ncbi:hypothetical protein JK386_17860 [Nocardioides sp. zg-536]|uniref:Uncharacterized protein n=1 Tax=Nocardioides faecalis TaxID=2803858 RepID=A0A938Y4J8_9ACTN|nr:hypothetical protein [Nocardioides faecalis]MBM9461761.1 hypothetical protein [Nocardioides faecalis]MBS4752241.1 hypothetical protein [Nocardioides faecalis]QVI58960.1 hypothetical protein KG111_00730 [Nocardioides faecalis]
MNDLTRILVNALRAIGLCTMVGVVGGLVFGFMTDDVATSLAYGLGIGAAAGAVFGFLAAVRTPTSGP